MGWYLGMALLLVGVAAVVMGVLAACALVVDICYRFWRRL